MYRIVLARNGFYYVQARTGWCGAWKRCSPFYRHKSMARTWVVHNRTGICCATPHVVEYL